MRPEGVFGCHTTIVGEAAPTTWFPFPSGEFSLTALLQLSRWIDAFTERIGRSVSWLVLITVVISAGNAIVRKVFNNSSNALLEIQWYLFAATFLLAAGYTMLRQEHV